MTRDPRLVAYDTVNKLMEKGIRQGHVPEAWREEDPRMHVLKAIRHLSTYLLVLDGHASPDGENHAENAICRAVMALAQEPKR